MTAKEEKKKYRDVAYSLLREGVGIRIEALGYSMYPTIKPGTITYIKPVADHSELSQGDIIAWFRDDDIVEHRLVCKYKVDNEYWYITRGDSSRETDKPVSFSQIAGKLVFIEKRGRKVAPRRKTFIRESRYKVNSRKVWFIVRWTAVLKKIGFKKTI